MHLIEVIPLKKGLLLESLSYFSSTPYPIGTIVEAPVRNSTTPAVVVDIKEVSSAKTALRAATFSLRKLPVQTNVHAIAPGLMKTAQHLRATSVFPLGTILFSLLPAEIKNGTATFPATHAETPHNVAPHQPELLHATTNDRITAYRSIIRSTFAHRGSVLVVVPSYAHLDPIGEALKQGIEDRMVYMRSSTGKRLHVMYEKYEDCARSKVIITTPAHAYLDRHDITTIIVEGSRSQHYVEHTQPYGDHRENLRHYARVTGKRIIFGDLLPRTEDEMALRNGVFTAFDEHPKRLELPAKLTYIERPEREYGTEYQILTPAVTEHIDQAVNERRSVFIYAPRRGLAPIVLCGDCGHIFRCEDSGAPYTLERTLEAGEERRWFVAKTTGKRIPAPDVCPVCSSWKLREQGIGIQKVQQQVHKLFPKAKVVVFDSVSAKSERRAKELMTLFYKHKGSILIGTSMVFPYLAEPVDTSIVASLDAARATPTWRSQEELFGLILMLRERSTHEVILQGKGDADELIELAKKGMTEQFYNEEIALRQVLLYPPMTRFIHLTWRAKGESGKAYGEKLKTLFGEFHTHLYADPNLRGEVGLYYLLIRVAEADWPNESLLQKLRTLPPSVRVVMNPDRII